MAHFTLETAPTWFGGSEMTHPADEDYNDSFSMIEGSSSLALGGALEHLLQTVNGRPLPAPKEEKEEKRTVSASPSFVVVDRPDGAEHYFPAPRKRLTKRHRRRSSLCTLM